jgi:acyl carrier protein
MQDVSKKVAQILVEKLGIAESEITADANLVKDLGIDSLDYAEIVMDFEQTFDIKIPDDDAEKLSTVGSAVQYIEEKLSKK